MEKKYTPFSINLFKSTTSSQLASISDYILHNERGILRAQEEMDAALNSSKYESYEDFNSDWENVYKQVHVFFPNFFRESTFITIFSFLEAKLEALCDRLTRIKGYKITLCHLNGDGIQRARTFLKVVAELTIESIDVLWNKITEYQKIRNCFTHHNGSIKGREKIMTEIIKRHPHLELNGSRIEIVNDEFLQQFIALLNECFANIIGIVKDQIVFEGK